MKQLTLFLYMTFVVIVLSSCASSMTPSEVNSTLPTLTQSSYYSQAQAIAAQNSNKCTVLFNDRNYVAPIGFSVTDDLKNGAKGIDEWVQIDGGNAYVLVNYKWVTVDQDGATQLHLDFATMKCN